MKFRPPGPDDWATLFEWRVAEGRDDEDNRKWADRVKHRLFVGIVNAWGPPLGWVLLKNRSGALEIGWYVSKEMRGRGHGREMVAAAALAFPGPIYAEIEKGNVVSECVARTAGFEFLQTLENGNDLHMWTTKEAKDG